MTASQSTEASLASDLLAAGIEAGDSLVVHSSFRSLGPVEGGPPTVLAAILRVIGPLGNLMLPTFNYTRPLPEPYFDVATTPCRTGVIPELGRCRPDAVRSLHPTHSVAVIGPRARDLTENHLQVRAFGVGSPLDRLAAMGGKVLLLGVGQTSNSTIHVAEEHAGIPKCSVYDPLPLVKLRLPDSGQVIEHPLDASPSCSTAFETAAYVLRSAGAVRDATIGGGSAQIMRGSAVIELLVPFLAKQPAALFCSDPKCLSCRRTQAAMGRE